MRRRGWVLATVVTVGIVAALTLPRIAPGGDDRPEGSTTSGRAAELKKAEQKKEKKELKRAGKEKSDEDASEVAGSTVVTQPEAGGAVSAADGLPGLEPVKPVGALVFAPLPKTASRQNGIVVGFPQSVIPLPSGAVVQSTGVSSTANTLQVSLVADSRRSARNVLAFHRRTLTALGFEERPTPATGGSIAASFVKGADHLVVTATTATKRTTYSVFGTLHAGRRG